MSSNPRGYTALKCTSFFNLTRDIHGKCTYIYIHMNVSKGAKILTLHCWGLLYQDALLRDLNYYFFFPLPFNSSIFFFFFIIYNTNAQYDVVVCMFIYVFITIFQRVFIHITIRVYIYETKLISICPAVKDKDSNI